MRGRRAVAALTLGAFAVRFAWLMRSPEPSGWDGWYYVAQAKHLVEDGHFHVADVSWVLWLLSLPHVLGVPAITGVKLVAALLAAACVPAAFLLGRRVDARAGWWLALWAAGSPALTHLAGDFPKNLGAAPVLLLGLALSERPLLSLVFAALSGWAHRLGAVLALAAAPGVSKRWWAGLVLLAGVGAIALWPTNAPRLREAFGLAWPPPPWAYFALRPTSWPEAIELSLALPALLLGAWAFVRGRQRALVASLWVPLLVCALPLWRTDTLDLGYRLALMAPLFAVPLLVVSMPRLPAVWFAAPLALLAVTGFDPHATPDYARYRRVIAAIPRPLPELLIAHQGINFLYDVETGAEAMAWAPEQALERTKVFRLAWGFTDGEWLDFECVRIDDDYVLVREDVWERFVKTLPSGDERLSDHRNPMKVRPGK